MSVILMFFSGCLQQKFFPDPDDPELSRFTSSHYQTGTCYINDTVYMNWWPKGGINLSPTGRLPFPSIEKTYSVSTPDSIDFSWRFNKKNDTIPNARDYRTILYRVPVPEGFTTENILNLSGQRFNTGQCTVYLDLEHKQGQGNIYFVKVKEIKSKNNPLENNRFFQISGLFDGNIGDSIYIKKGRFDYVVEARIF